jgi:PPP family 3-phenylpropionic acid transporter
VISLLASVQSFTRVFAPYAWGALSDHTGERVRLLRISAAGAGAVLRPLVEGRCLVDRLVLLLLFTHTSSMMSLTEAAMAHLVAGDWGRYGRVRLWGSAGLHGHGVRGRRLVRALRHGQLPRLDGGDAGRRAGLHLVAARRAREAAPGHGAPREPVGPVLRQPVVRWFLASLFFHVMAHFAIYGFLSLYLDASATARP